MIGPLKFRQLKSRHPSINVPYLDEIRALYEGGETLLNDLPVLKRLLLRMPGETEPNYTDRIARAWYEPVMAEVIDFMVAGLGQDPARLCEPGEDGDDEEIKDERMKAFSKRVSPPGSCDLPMDFHRLLAESARNALLYRRWWTLVDAPYMGPDYRPVSLADQERDGALDSYAIPLGPTTVMDWEEVSGELAWAITSTSSQPRPQPSSDRSITRQEYRLYTRDQWALYVVESSSSRPPPNDDAVIEPVAVESHPFGRVPLIGGTLNPGMWAGARMHSVAREFLAQSTGMTYAGHRGLFPQLYEFLAPSIPGVDEPIDAHTADIHRAVRSPRGPGRVQTRAQNDRAEYITPDVAPYQHAMAVADKLRSALFAVTYQMALGADTKGAVIRRSAESKGKDGEAATVILRELGDLLRPHGAQVAAAAARVRSPMVSVGWDCKGLENFDAAALQDQIDQAVLIEGVSIPSATYQVRRKLRLVRSDLGADATPEVMEMVEQELEQAITQDQFMGMPATGRPAPGDQGKAPMDGEDPGTDGTSPDDAPDDAA